MILQRRSFLSRPWLPRFAALALLVAGLLPAVGTPSPASTPAGHQDWYVDGQAGKDSNTGTSAGTAFLTVLHAWRTARPGDTIHLLPTTPYPPVYLQDNAGTATAWITLRGDGVFPNLTRIAGDGKQNGLKLDTHINYVHITNLDISAPGNLAAIFVINSHHTLVDHNVLHDAGAAGFSSYGSDYLTVDHNIVYHTAWGNTASMFGSGISIGESVDTDASTGTKMWITNNYVYNNYNQQPASGCSSPCDSDGSGIILDNNRRTDTTQVPYRGAFMVANNVVFRSGGRGLHIYKSDNVTAIDNTFYANNQDPDEDVAAPGEIMCNFCGGANIYNNILYSPAGRGHRALKKYAVAVTNGSGDPVDIDYNLMFAANSDQSLASYTGNNANTVTIGAHNKWGDPKFRNMSTDATMADFRVLPGSAALGFQSPAGTYARTDRLGAPRTLPVTAGAYQVVPGAPGTAGPGASPDRTPPGLVIIAPRPNARVGATQPVSITTSDNVGVTRVQLFLDGRLLTTQAGSRLTQYRTTLTKIPPGRHYLLIQADDAAGNWRRQGVWIQRAH